MKHTYLILVLLTGFLSMPFCSHSQDTKDSLRYISIAGQIKNSESGEIISGVKITNETRNNTVLSKQNGFYTLVAVTGDIIRFTHVGFEPIYMKVNQAADSKETIMVQMDPSNIELEEVVVGELPSLDELDEAFMALEVDEDQSRRLAEQNPETFRILEEIETPEPGGPVSFLKKHVFDKLKKKSKKPARGKKLPKFKK